MNNKVVRLSNDDGITKETLRVVKNRVLPLLLNQASMDFNLETLAVSCYLQGCRDMTGMLISKGVKI